MGKPSAVIECVLANGGKAVREGDVGKPGAALECAFSNGGQSSGSRKSDGGKSCATIECVGFNGGKALRKSDMGDRIFVWSQHVFGDDSRVFGEG